MKTLDAISKLPSYKKQLEGKWIRIVKGENDAFYEQHPCNLLCLIDRVILHPSKPWVIIAESAVTYREDMTVATHKMWHVLYGGERHSSYNSGTGCIWYEVLTDSPHVRHCSHWA